MRIVTSKSITNCHPASLCKRVLFFALIGGALLLSMSAEISFAAPTYRIIDLGVVPGDDPTLTGCRAFGLNNLGQVVGETGATPVTGQRKAFVWLFDPAYGLSARQMIALSTQLSTAQDINDSGQAAGRLGTIAIGSAFIWQLGGSPSTINLGTLGGITAIASGINDQSPAWAVGESETAGFCGIFAPEQRAFRVLLDSTHTLQSLQPPAPHMQSKAFDVNSNPSSLRTVGASGPCGGAANDCNLFADGVRWLGTNGGALSRLSGSIGEHQAKGVNDVGNIVGFAFRSEVIEMELTCMQRALFWDSDSASTFNLGTVAPIPLEQSTFANAINEPQELLVQVVGKNETTDRGFLWERSATGQWQAHDLTDLLINPCGWLRVDEATDINDNGWICGWGITNHERAYLLIPTPIECLADLNLDCVINSLDLGILLSSWSLPATAPGCGGAIPCSSDFNCDGLVNSSDLGVLLSSWTIPPATTCSDDCVASGSMMMSGGGGAPMSMAQTVEEDAGPPTIPELVELLIEMGEPEPAALLQQVAEGH